MKMPLPAAFLGVYSAHVSAFSMCMPLTTAFFKMPSLEIHSSLFVSISSLSHQCSNIRAWSQFTINNVSQNKQISHLIAFCCVLHRHSTRVIHWEGLYFFNPPGFRGLKGDYTRFHTPCVVWSENDPSAGSPTETLLRLFLPTNKEIHLISQVFVVTPHHGPSNSSLHSIGRSDGRCVQKAGTKSVQYDELRLLEIPRSRACYNALSQSYRYF